MSWYYAKDGQQLGPIDDSAWDALVKSGSISPDTMVWQDGMADWKPFRLVGSTTKAVLAGAVPSVCSQCGTRVPADELITLEGQQVCAACKPVVLQKLKEGVSLGGAFVYAGFWIRFAAKILDGIIVSFTQKIFAAGVLSMFHLSQRAPEQVAAATAISIGISLLIGAAYTVFFLGRFGATPGKMVCRLKVIRPDGAKLTYGRAFGRWGAELLTNFTFTIGYLIAAFDEQKRALHDRVADTRVVKA